MPYGTNILVTMTVANAPKWAMPVPVNDGPLERETCVFHLASEDGSFSILGTYDQILDWCASIGQQIMSWPIVSGRQEWFGESVNPEQIREVSDGNRGRESAGSQVRSDRVQGYSGDSYPDSSRSAGAESVPGR